MVKAVIWSLALFTTVLADLMVAVRTESGEIITKGKIRPNDGYLEQPSKVVSKGCVGLVRNDTFECYTLFDTGNASQSWDSFMIYFDESGSVSHIGIGPGDTGAGFFRPPVVAPPQYKTVPIQKSKSSHIKGDSAADTSNEAEEDTRPFLQKYWYYLLPIVIIALTGGGGADGGAATS